MPNFQTIVLDTATPQLRAPGTGDGYSFDSGATNLGVWTTTGLGIGTASPAVRLHVQGSAGQIMRVTDGTTGASIYSGGGLFGFNNQTGEDGMFGSTASHFLYFATNGSERARINSSGNLGIGTSSPSNGAKLDAAGAIISTAATLSSFNANNAGFDFVAASKIGRFFATSTDTTGGTMTFTTGQNGTYQTRMTILNDGNVGIGTNSPYTKLDVSGSTGLKVYFTGGTDGNSAGSIALGDGARSANYVGLYRGTSISGGAASNALTLGAFEYIGFNVSATTLGSQTERMRLNSSGNLGLGVTPSAWSQGRALEILNAGYGLWNGSGSPEASIYLTAGTYFDGGFKYSATSARASHYYQFQGAHVWSTAPSGTAGNAITFTQAMTLDASGNLGIGTTSPGALLDVYSATTSNYVRVGSASTFSAGLSIAANANTHLTSGSLVYQDSSNRLNLLNYANAALRLGTNNTFRVSVPAAGGIVVGTAALATNATDGFLYVPTCAGAPTGTPTAQTGTAPIVIDTTNNKLYFYSSGVWRDAGP